MERFDPSHGAISTVVVADSESRSRDQLGRDLANAGIEVWLSEDVATTLHLLETRSPSLLVLELKLSDGTWRDVFDGVSRPLPPTVILTSTGSIATAVAALKRGALNYLVKPTGVSELLHACSPPNRDDRELAAKPGPSLDRAIWELLCQAVETSGSISGAARNLGIDRRSLRRMLQKHPPAV